MKRKLLFFSTLIEAVFILPARKSGLDPWLHIQRMGNPQWNSSCAASGYFGAKRRKRRHWILNALEDGRAPQSLGEFQGGTKGDGASRRLAAARIVTAIGNWAQKGVSLGAKKPVQPETSGRWRIPRYQRSCSNRNGANRRTAPWANFSGTDPLSFLRIFRFSVSPRPGKCD